MKEINRQKLVSLIREDEVLSDVLPWSQTLVKYEESINKGCSCTRNKREKAAIALYVDIVNNFIVKDSDLKSFLKNHFGNDSIVFKEAEQVIASI
tara:strand:- start:110 stop:394 length:285 start_codon:yes stop_codon:yes gene_type:complete